MKKNSKSDLIILAGGFGTRLKSISKGTPKALMQIGNSTFLDLLLKKVFKYEISRIILSLCYKPMAFKKHIKNSIYSDKIITVVEPEPLGTGGAINYVLNQTEISKTFFVINGDSFSNTNLNQMIIDFSNKNFDAMLGISKVKNVKRYGSVSVLNDQIVSFNEKGEEGSGWINNGHYIFKKKVYNHLDGKFSLENDVLANLVKDSGLGFFKVENDNFIDIGTPYDYKKINKND